jgi:hypothetical protein
MADNFKISDLDFSEILYMNSVVPYITNFINNNQDWVHTHQVGLFIQGLTNAGLNVQDVAPHGNCLFEAVALQLMAGNIRNTDGGFYNHLELRAEAVEYIREHQNDYGVNQWAGILNDHNGINTIDDYLNHIGQNGIFAEHFLIQALADAVGVDIDVINLDESISEIISNNPNSVSVTILYTGNHYMSVIGGQAQGEFIPYILPQVGNSWNVDGFGGSFSAPLAMAGNGHHGSSDSLATQDTDDLWGEFEVHQDVAHTEDDLMSGALYSSISSGVTIVGGASPTSSLLQGTVELWGEFEEHQAVAHTEGDLMGGTLYSSINSGVTTVGGVNATSSLLQDTTNHTNSEADLAGALFMLIGNNSSADAGVPPIQDGALPPVVGADQPPVLELNGLTLEQWMNSI